MKSSINNRIITLNVIILLIFSISIIILLFLNYQSTKEQYESEAKNKSISIANLINSDLDRIIFGIESVLTGINDVIEAQINNTPFNEKTKNLLYSHKKQHILDLLIVNNEGEIVNWTQESNKPPSVLDREYVTFHLNKMYESSKIFIGNPLLSKVHKDKWFFAISKAFYKEKKLERILVAIVDIDFFSERYLKNIPSINSSIFVGSDKGFMYTRIPDHKKYVGKYVERMHEFVKSNLNEDAFYIKSPLDKKERLVVIVKSSNYPIVSGNTTLTKEILSKWERNKILTSIIILLIVIGIIILILLLIKNQRSLVHLSHTDSLTGLSNRHHFMEVAQEEFEKAKRLSLDLTIIMIDIDNFKQINDTHGHLEGDKVIKNVANAIKKNIRNIDYVGRYGGEEFIVMLLNSTSNEANEVSNRVKKYSLDNIDEIKFTSSFGISEIAPKDENIDDVIKRADQALYTSKREGKDRITIIS